MGKLSILAHKPGPVKQTIHLEYFIRCEPLELQYLEAVLPDHEVFLLDGITHRYDPVQATKDHQFDVVLITAFITQINLVLDLATQLKELDRPPLIFIGGTHAEVVPENFYHPAVDGVFFANQLEAIAEVINRIQNKQDYKTVPGGSFRQGTAFQLNPCDPIRPDSIPIIEHHLVNSAPRNRYKYLYYKPIATVKTANGCTGRCSFCFCTEMHGKNYGARSIGHVIEEIKNIEVEHIWIIDDNFLINKSRILKFCTEIERHQLKKKFILYGDAKFIANNSDVIKRLWEVGLVALIVGLEFISDRAIQSYNKDALVQDNNATIQLCHELEIDLFALFMLDPAWTRKEFRKMAAYLWKQPISFALFSTLTVFPGTETARQNPEIHKNETQWWRYDLLRLHQQPTHMSSTQYYCWLFFLYILPGFKWSTMTYLTRKFGMVSGLRHAFGGFVMGIDYLIKLIRWK